MITLRTSGSTQRLYDIGRKMCRLKLLYTFQKAALRCWMHLPGPYQDETGAMPEKGPPDHLRWWRQSQPLHGAGNQISGERVGDVTLYGIRNLRSLLSTREERLGPWLLSDLTESQEDEAIPSTSNGLPAVARSIGIQAAQSIGDRVPASEFATKW